MTLTIASVTRFIEKIPQLSQEAQMMTEAYAVLHMLENALRGFIRSKLEEEFGQDWWSKV